ncbi:L-rhamnose mutarotase [Salegentibacter salinarum]|uniref:L-rhamnose mutarotase n=1 Tax=Salegentibacter salinarum TaxID=447422 RepID=A0A2N0TSJ5_9FLAO|nr:L-rhamnose mutarotase [Salegentibacter salinarum]PKD17712.1 L-rhamnose mutarotase [Salegentibacter salinarum]SKB51328.1 L-rhamnose mutarotase [Salegentibacter salinarum]
MSLRAFKMKLLRGFEAEYKRRHDEIWPELSKLLSERGIYDYNIFLDEETHILFAVQKVKNEKDLTGLREEPILQKWWDYMSDIMETNPDNSPVEKPLERVFHMD